MENKKGCIPQAAPTRTPSSGDRKHVHTSYIWLGSIRSVGVLVIALVIGSASSIGSLIEAYQQAHQAAIRHGVDIPDYGNEIAIVAALALAALVLVLALVVGIHFWAWRHLWYELGPEEVSVYSGIISKKRVHVPYDRIQTVDQKASLLQRAFGVCNVTIDTAGGASNKAVLIPYLRKGDADALRHELYARKMGAASGTVIPSTTPPPVGAPVIAAQAPATAACTGNVLDIGDEAWRQFGGVFAGDAFDLGAPSFEYRLTNKELVFTGLSNNGGVVLTLITILAAVGSIVSFAFDLFPNEANAIVAGTTSQFEPAILAVMIGVILIVCTIIGWCISVLGTCIQYGGFHARRRGARVEVERGLLKHQTESLDMGRVQSIIVKQSFIRRLIGYCELSLGKVNAGEADSSNEASGVATQGLVVHPFLKVDRVPEVLRGLVPEFAGLPDDRTPLAPVALRRGLIRRCLWQGNGFWVAASVAILQLIAHGVATFEPDIAQALPGIDLICAVLYGFAVVFLILDAVGSVLWYRESSFAVNKRFARIKNGGLSSTDISVPRQKIQFSNTKTNPFQRMAKTATIQMRTAAGVGGTTTQLIDVSQDEAAAWLAWITPKVSRPANPNLGANDCGASVS